MTHSSADILRLNGYYWQTQPFIRFEFLAAKLRYVIPSNIDAFRKAAQAKLILPDLESSSLII
jgi:hypothetical protein